jgi:protein-S-isoprenylcysteine O-methyltransferase Ste14
MRFKSLLFVAVQFLCIGYLILTGHLFVAPSLIWLELAGIGIVLWAVFVIRPHRVNPLPDLRRNARLVTRGPYRWVRHPMYTGVLAIALAWLLDTFTGGRLIATTILAADLLAKASYEETLLRKRFPEYAAYAKRTKRMIPFVY